METEFLMKKNYKNNFCNILDYIMKIIFYGI